MLKPLSVAVFIDLYQHPNAGGHVKSWERFADAATQFPQRLNLDIHLLGDTPVVTAISNNVRYIRHKPRFSSGRLPLIGRQADHTDLAKYHPELAQQLTKYDLLHTTHPNFALSKTALQFAQQQRIPLTTSIHTDVPKYTEIYLRGLIERYLKPFSKLLLDKWHIAARRAAAIQRELAQHWACCEHIIVSQPAEAAAIQRLWPDKPCSYLRRGIDTQLFSPAKRERQRLQQSWDIAPETNVLLYVGRIDACKNVELFAELVNKLLQAGYPVVGMLVGRGAERAQLEQRWGDSLLFTGAKTGTELAWLYASADIFVFPSTTETYGNVVLEAKASGLPVVISTQGGTGQLLAENQQDGIYVATTELMSWYQAVQMLLENPKQRQQIGQAARTHMLNNWPDWQQVFAEDILAVWEQVWSFQKPENKT